MRPSLPFSIVAIKINALRVTALGCLCICLWLITPAAAPAQTVTTKVVAGSKPLTVAVNPVTNTIYVVNQTSGTVTVIGGATNATYTVLVGANPVALAVNPLTNKIYVVNNLANDVTVIDGATDDVSTVATGHSPEAVAVNPITDKIYVANADGTVTVIDGTTNATSTVQAGSGPVSVAVNPVTNKIYVANSRGNNMTVIDGASNTIITVATGAFPYAVAVNPVTNKIYVANNSNSSKGDSVTVIDGVTNATTTVAAGTNPIAVAVNPVTNKIYVANSSSNNVTVIDGANNTTTTVAAGTSPVGVTVNVVTNQVYVVGNSMTVIDGATNATSTVAGSVSGFDVAVNPVTNKIYVPDNNSEVTVIDGATNTTSTVADGSGPAALAVNPVTDMIYVANANAGNLTVIAGLNDSSAEFSLPAGTVSGAVVVNSATNKIYILDAINNDVVVINAATDATKIVSAGSGPTAAAVNPITDKIYVANYTGDTVTVIDGATNATATVTVGASPVAVAVNPATNKIYVADKLGNTVTVIDGDTNMTTTIAAGSGPSAVAVNPITNKIYVANAFSDTVTVMDGLTSTATTVAAGSGPTAVAVNSTTNKIYVANYSSSTVTVIDGVSNAVTTVATSAFPSAVAVNPVTNKIYVATHSGLDSDSVTVIDGATNTTTAVPVGSGATAIAVNPVTNAIYVASTSGNSVTVLTEQQVESIPLVAAIAPLPNNITAETKATFDFTASSFYAPVAPAPQNVYYQVDTWQGEWLPAIGSAPSFSGQLQLASFMRGSHILYAWASDDTDATDLAAGETAIGAIAAYQFTVDLPQLAPSLTVTCAEVTYDGNPHPCAGAATGMGEAAVSGWWSFSPATETEVGSYTVKGTFASTDPNYAGGTAIGVLKINVAAPTLSLSCPSISYDGSPHSCTGEATGVGGEPVDGSWSFSPANGTNLGSYPMTGTFTSRDQNYSGGTANGTLTIDGLQPVISSLSPAIQPAGAKDFVLTVSGSGFARGASVHWNGSARTTIFESDSKLMASIVSTDLAAVGKVNVTVTNPTVAGGTVTSPFVFAVDTPAGTNGMITVTPSTSSVTVSRASGQPAMLAISLSGANASAVITTTCVNLPPGVTCYPYQSSSQSMSIGASSSAAPGIYQITAIFTMSQQPTVSQARGHMYFAVCGGFLGLPLGWLWIGESRSRIRKRILAAFIALVLLPCLAGCGGVAAAKASPPVTSQSSVAVALTVQ